MHKCTNCGLEFDGKFCPRCGAAAADSKTCPSCGAQLKGGVKFCPECGYSFTDGKAAPAAHKGNGGAKAIGWIKAHLKVLIPSVLGLIVIIVMLSLIPTFIAIPSNGAYYTYSEGEFSKTYYITLKNYKWSDNEGGSGKYKLSGKNITLTETFLGESITIKGTVKNGVLTLDSDGDGEADGIYVRKNHKHKYGGWETDYETTCASAGQRSRSCACGYKDKNEIEKLPHKLSDWDYDYDNHWKVCSVCENKDSIERHSGDTVCLLCGYENGSTIGLKIYNGGVYGIGTATETEIIKPSTYKGNPVTSIGERAFMGCSGLTSITIPDSVTSVGSYAFDGCSSLTVIDFNGTKAQWKAIKKDYCWANITGNYTVQCTDGKLNKNGNEIN